MSLEHDAVFSAQIRLSYDRGVMAGSRWNHYSGKTYVVVGLSRSEANSKVNVLYRPLLSTGGFIPWSRPLDEWLSDLPSVGPRFTKFSS